VKIIGYTLSNKTSSPFVDEVVKFTSYSELDCDYAIDISSGDLVQDPRPFLSGGAAYYGDYYDPNGNYSLHSMFPSKRSVYPGIIYKASLLRDCKTNNPLEELAKENVIYYIPKPMFKIGV
jgi:hypothetical protein